MIYIQKLSKSYGAVEALAGLSLLIEDGEFVALLGPNGCGKSTLIRSLLGIHDFDGSIRINGLDPLSEGKQARRSIGYMPQQSGLHLELTVEETLVFYCRLKKVTTSRASQLLNSLNLQHKLRSKVGELSGGMRQRLSFGVALLADPDILILDEPTASMDTASQDIILSLLDEQHALGRTILLSTHLPKDIATRATRLITLEDGRLIADERRTQQPAVRKHATQLVATLN